MLGETMELFHTNEVKLDYKDWAILKVYRAVGETLYELKIHNLEL
jgi:hypothetical protein